MTCRVARSFHNSTRMEPVFCCACGSTNLEVFSTANTLGPHLCASCAQSFVECGWAKELGAEPVRCLVPS